MFARDVPCASHASLAWLILSSYTAGISAKSLTQSALPVRWICAHAGLAYRLARPREVDPTRLVVHKVGLHVHDELAREWEEVEDKPAAQGAPPKKLKFKLAPYQAKEFKQSLKLKEPLQEVMAWTPEQLQARMLAFKASSQAWETDYSRLLIFVAGNLDEMYSETATRVQDCDTDADIFHSLTKKLFVIDVKKALSERFKPEQIARLGNNHVIYPSLSQATYERLIRSTCANYVSEVQASSGLRFRLDDSVYTGIYANAVFPAQGTRPLFSSVHAILSAPLVSATLWAIEHGAGADEVLQVSLDPVAQCLRITYLQGDHTHGVAYPVPLDLNQLKQRASPDFRALLAVQKCLPYNTA